MARYIEAVKSAEIISEKLNIPLGDLVDVFAEIPTADVVEVVRCKDCKHGHWSQKTCRGTLINYCDRTYFEVNKNDFCSYGERKGVTK